MSVYANVCRDVVVSLGTTVVVKALFPDDSHVTWYIVIFNGAYHPTFLRTHTYIYIYNLYIYIYIYIYI